MITREQLELAALAAGHTIGWGEETPCQPHVAYIWNADSKTSRWWRPHLDDGDAARLAVRLGMEIEHPLRKIVARSGEHAAWAVCQHDGTEPDKLRAWREAVVLCAAAVGAKTKGGA